MIEQKIGFVSDAPKPHGEIRETLGRHGYVAARLSMARAAEFRRRLAEGLVTLKTERPSKSALFSLD
jgi:hypothetical protein